MADKGTETKQKLLNRFLKAREVIGVDWRNELANSDPFFNTKVGSDYMIRAASAVTNISRIGIDRLERVVLSLEKVAESFQQTV